MGCFLGLCKLANKIEKFFRPVTKIAAVGAAVYYGGGAILAAPGGAAAAGAFASSMINGRRQSTAGPLPQENSAPYGVGGQVYTQGREPYSSPAVPSSFGGSASYTPGDSGSPGGPSPGISPLVLLGGAVAGTILLIVLLRR